MQVALEARVAQEQLATQVYKVPQVKQVSLNIGQPPTWSRETLAKVYVLH